MKNVILILWIFVVTPVLAEPICGQVEKIESVKDRKIDNKKYVSFASAKLKNSEIPLPDLTQEELILLTTAKMSQGAVCVTLIGGQKEIKERIIELK